MAFYPSSGNSGQWDIQYFRKKASTAFTSNTLVALSSDVDTIEPADASDAALVGIVLKDVTSADSDYASNTLIPVAVPVSQGALFEGDITTGTIAVTDEGNEVDLTDAAGADVTASSTDVLTIYRFISTTKAIFKLNKPYVGF